MRLLFFVFMFTLLCGFANAQENQSPSKAQAFLLDETSPDKAIELLGKPQSDKIEKIDVLFVSEWLAAQSKKEKYRVLYFEKFEDLGKVKLTFLKDKLVAITFLIEKDVPAARLSAIYKVQFIPIFNEFGRKTSVSEFDKVSRNVSSANFPRHYHLIGTSKTSVLTAKVFSENELAPNIGRDNKGGENIIRTKPITGKVTDLQILSRTILK